MPAVTGAGFRTVAVKVTTVPEATEDADKASVVVVAAASASGTPNTATTASIALRRAHPHSNNKEGRSHSPKPTRNEAFANRERRKNGTSITV